MAPKKPAERSKAQQADETAQKGAAPGAVVRDTPAAASGETAQTTAGRGGSDEVVEVVEVVRRRPAEAIDARGPEAAPVRDELPRVPRKAAAAPPDETIRPLPGFHTVPRSIGAPVVASQPRGAEQEASDVAAPAERRMSSDMVRETLEATVVAAEGWRQVMSRTQSDEAHRREVVSEAAMAAAKCPDPPYVIRKRDLERPRLEGKFRHSWLPFAHELTTFTSDEVVMLGRTDADLANTGTGCDSAWAYAARGRFMGRLRGCYQVPATIGSDVSFIRTQLDAVYLEGMHAYLTGALKVPPIMEERFWKFDLPLPSKSGERTDYDRIRTEWALCRVVRAHHYLRGVRRSMCERRAQCTVRSLYWVNREGDQVTFGTRSLRAAAESRARGESPAWAVFGTTACVSVFGHGDVVATAVSGAFILCERKGGIFGFPDAKLFTSSSKRIFPITKGSCKTTFVRGTSLGGNSFDHARLWPIWFEEFFEVCFFHERQHACKSGQVSVVNSSGTTLYKCDRFYDAHTVTFCLSKFPFFCRLRNRI